MALEFLTERFAQNPTADAIIWRDSRFTYSWLLDAIARWRSQLGLMGVYPGSITALEADFSPEAVALFLALVDQACILVPLVSPSESEKRVLIDIAQAEVGIRIDGTDRSIRVRLPYAGRHQFFSTLRNTGHAGLILFTSGSTGLPRAAVHDFSKLLSKFSVKRPARRTLSFLLFDHIGGVNTMLHTLSNGGCLVLTPGRTPEDILRTIQSHNVELLPTSPTFLNLLLVSGALDNYKLDSLRLITYGTEPMPESTLSALNTRLPGVQFQQTYGSSEMGILRSKSKSSQSLWVKLGGPGFETRVVDGILQIKAETAMMGYLNAPSPFTSDGWFNTEDRVEQDDDYFRILGRDSDLINVGGQKVFPAEVSSVIGTLDNVGEVFVYGEEGPLGGHIVCALVSLLRPEDKRAAAQRIIRSCTSLLASYKVPIRVTILDGPLHNKRFKTGQRSPIQKLPTHRVKVAFVFPGQAPSWPATGRELLRSNPIFRSRLEECDRLFRELADWSVLDEVAGIAEPSRLAHTAIAQPVTFAVQVALIDVLKNVGALPDGVVGHSMGEIAAAYCAGALELRDAVRVAYHRARLTERAAGLGRMIWVLCPFDKMREMLSGREDQISIAANNEPTTTVVSGPSATVLDFADFLRGRGIGVHVLPFDHGFHSPLMTPFQPELEAALDGIHCSHVTTPIVSTIEGDFVPGAIFDARYWARNMRETVKFVTAIDRLVEAEFDVFLEVGPHALLGKSVSQCAANLQREATVLSTLCRGEVDSSGLERSIAALRHFGVVRPSGLSDPPISAET